MAEQLTEYTFTFDKEEENRFRSIMSRLDDDEYIVKQDIQLTDPADKYNKEMTAIIEMVPEAASTFRFGMKNLKIRRLRTAEELAAEAEAEAKNKITINVKADGTVEITGPGYNDSKTDSEVKDE